MSIEVEHRGYTIRFSENADEWSCLDVEDIKGRRVSSQSLSKVKAAIDKMLLDVRKANAVDCFELAGDHGWEPKATETRIIEYVEQKKDRVYNPKTGNSDLVAGAHIVGCVARRNGNKQAARRNVKLDDLMPDTPDAHAALAQAKAAHERKTLAEQEYRRAFAAIPRVTIDMIPRACADRSRPHR